MKELDVRNAQGVPIGHVTVPDLLSEGDVHVPVLHQAVVAYLANQRQGTASTRTRSEVAGSGRKMFRQKGLGRARMGDSRSPVRVHGAVAHGPRPRDYRQRTPRKMRRLALVSALRDRFQADAVTVVERLPVEGDHPKTKPFAQMLEALGLAARKVLIVLPEADPVAYRSARNLPRVSVTTSGLLSAYDVMAHGDLLLTPESLHALEARLGASEAPGAAEAS